jgi:FkbM family methyltransferase
MNPATVLDVGAAFGDFSRTCSSHFPDAHYVLIEPLHELIPQLESSAARLVSSEIVNAVISDSDGAQILNVHQDLVGSSILLESEGGNINGQPREVSGRSIDSIVDERNLHAPYFLKLDVQGAETLALDGATQTLNGTELILLEVAMFDYFDSGHSFSTMLQYLKNRGFETYDIFNPVYRPLDGALSQVDLALVPTDSSLRSEHHYATPAQRERIDSVFRTKFGLRK